MHLAKHAIWIDKPREAVFDFFVDFSQAARWRQYVQSMTLVSDPPLRAGSRVRTTLDLMGGRHTVDLEVLALERPSLWRHRTFETDFHGYIEYRFEADTSGTRVTMTMDVQPNGLYGWLALPIMRLERVKPYKEQLPRLKRALEGS